MQRSIPSRPLPADDRPLRTPVPYRAARSRAVLNLPGLCPLCGGEAVRRLTMSPGERRETYRCARDGETSYVSQGEARRVIAPPYATVRSTHGLLDETALVTA